MALSASQNSAHPHLAVLHMYAGSSGDHQPFKAAASNPLGADQLVKAEQTEEANPTGIIAVPGQQIVQVNVKAEEDDKLGVALRVIAALEARIQALEGRVQALELGKAAA